MYVHQATHITKGAPQSSSGYVYNEAYPMLGPVAYPIGYPMILAPVVAVWGDDMLALLRYQSLLLIGFAGLLFLFFRKHYATTASVLLALIVAYNPWTLNFKRELMSDLPFAMLLLGAYLGYKRSKNPLPGGLLAGLAIATRSIGWAWVPSLLLELLTTYVRHRRGKGEAPNYRRVIITLALAIGIPLLLNRLVFRIPSGFSLYSQNLDFSEIYLTFLHNLAYYIDVLKWFFQTPHENFKFLGGITKAVIFSLVLLGWINRIFTRFRFMDCLVIVYLGILLVYPYRSSGFRFLLPILPFLLIYAIEGFERIRFSFSIPSRYKALILGCLILVQYAEGIDNILGRQSRTLQGPQEAESVEAFAKIRELTPKDAKIAFSKARVLAFYTGRSSGINLPDQAPEAVKAWYEAHGFEYFLTHKQLGNKGLSTYLEREKDQLVHLWGNKWFDLYQKRSPVTEPQLIE